MSDRTCAFIEIGGRLPRSKANTLLEAINRTRVSHDWGDATFQPETADDLLTVTKDSHLWLCDDQASYGEFPEFESVCRRLALFYIRCSDGGVVYDAGRVDWRPGMKKPLARRCSTESNGCILVPQEAVEKALAALDSGHVPEARGLLRWICRQVPPVPPFEIV